MNYIVMNIIMNFREVVLWLAILNIVIALLLLALPDIFSVLNRAANKWISIEKIEEVLNKRRNVDDSLMKARKAVGYLSAALAAALLFIYFKKM
jgi:hypothetical protein